ncbi:YybH family protein [Streptomyces odontomachi]|uniref:YybH family protein n=1 Tax=Streptomyces odontomachi TaxID=2944940 RepID=UPI00210EF485|nr:SgcJ/EcaC family oxidoreductase [Streptomyces sp. ODS25]
MNKRNALAFCGVVLSVTLLSSCGDTKESDGSGDRAAVRELHAEIDAAWNSGNAKEFAAHWTKDGTVTSPLGQLSQGRSHIQKDEAAGFAGPMKGTRHKLAVSKIYWVGAQTAVVDGDAEISGLKGTDGKTMAPLKAKFTSVCIEQNGKWLVSHLRSYVFLKP